MKKFVVILLVAVCFMSFSELKAQNSLKVGIVSLETIVKEIPEAVKADQELQDLAKKYQDTLIAMKDEFDERLKQYQKQQSMMTADKKKAEEEALQQLQMSIMQYQEEKFGQTGELAVLRDQYLEPIRKKVKDAIEDVAKEEGINLVLDEASSAVLYSQDKMNITYKVLDRIKRGSEE